jgi:hypothetical protein
VVSKTKVMSYKDIVEAQARQDTKDALPITRYERKTWKEAQELCNGGSRGQKNTEDQVRSC